MENGVKQRVIDLAEIKCDSLSAFTKAINVGQSTMSEYINRGKKPSGVIITAILKQFPDVSAEWLLRGEGDLHKKTEELPPVDVTSEESINHSAEIAQLTKKINQLIDERNALNKKVEMQEEVIDRLSKENIALAAQRDMAKDLLREYMMNEPAQKVG